MSCVTDLIKANNLGMDKMQSPDKPAFPHIVDEKKYIYSEGMTLRDYFAAKVMQSYLTHEQAANHEVSIVAGWAYEMADAMLKERMK